MVMNTAHQILFHIEDFAVCPLRNGFGEVDLGMRSAAKDLFGFELDVPGSFEGRTGDGDQVQLDIIVQYLPKYR